MLTVTPSAWRRIAGIISRRPDVNAVRLRYINGEFRCGTGSPREHDRIITGATGSTLLMTAAVARSLTNRTLDAPETDRGPRLQLLPETA
ncbi:MAG: hypothetical protein KDA81_09345 [Planctomycetaceae bacterium]|nr:hypothetical protein [Planctomycetaceae bacterium]